MRRIIWLIVFGSLVYSLGGTPAPAPPATMPTTAFSSHLRSLNLGPVGQWIEARAKDGSEPEPQWLSGLSADQKKRVLADLDTWSIVITEAVETGPNAKLRFAADVDPRLSAVPTGPDPAVGLMTAKVAKRKLGFDKKNRAEQVDQIFAGVDWTTGRGHEIPVGVLVTASVMSIPVYTSAHMNRFAPDKPVATGIDVAEVRPKAEDFFIPMPMHVPTEVVDALKKEEPLTKEIFPLSNYSAHPPDKKPGADDWSVMLEGIKSWRMDGTGFELKPVTMIAEVRGDECHIAGYIAITTSELGSVRCEHDLGYDVRMHVRKAEGGLEPTDGTTTWSWPTGPEAALAATAATRPTTQADR